MKFKPVKLAPALIAACVVLLICAVRLTQPDFFERLEQITYDMRARLVLRFPAPATTNLGFIFISDDSIRAVNDGSLGFHYGLYWPRHIYARAYRELAAQGAKAVAFDVLFPDQRRDHGQVPVSNGQWPEVNQFYAALHPGQPPPVFEQAAAEKFTYLESDEYFAWQLKRGGTAILAAEQNVPPLDLFATNALAVADIAAYRDADGVLRRARAFSDYRQWHPAFRQAAAEGYVELSSVRQETNRIIFLRPGEKDVAIPVDAENNFDLADFGGEKLPAGMARKAKAFTTRRVWHMGIVLAAQVLGLDLETADIDLAHGRIVLRGAGGVERVIPVDADGSFYINWELTSSDRRLTSEPLEKLLVQDRLRNDSSANSWPNLWAGKLVVIGSKATGNDLTDRGATPLEKDTFLVTKHWNVANSVITGRFVRRASLGMELGLIVLLGLLTALMTWEFRMLPAAFSVLSLVLIYGGIGAFVFVQDRYWLPLILPGATVVLTQFICLIAYRVLVEQAEKRRVKSVFSKIVSPNIVNELLDAEKLSLGGARREITVLFADVRGFTEFTDKNQEQAAAYVAANQLTGAAREAYFDEQAREALATINLYLGVVADIILQQEGTLDKFIGDCVMAFWGAPLASPKPALACVRAAIGAQQAIYELNRQRAEHNRKLAAENRARASAGLPQKTPLPILLLGSGINTGIVTVGMMGSETKTGVLRQGSYTVFGREVNLASRLEGVSGRGRIVISEATYEHLRRDDPILAANCVALVAEKVKGIREAVKIYEVPWRPPGSPSLDEEFFPGQSGARPPETDLILRKNS